MLLLVILEIFENFCQSSTGKNYHITCLQIFERKAFKYILQPNFCVNNYYNSVDMCYIV